MAGVLNHPLWLAIMPPKTRTAINIMTTLTITIRIGNRIQPSPGPPFQ